MKKKYPLKKQPPAVKKIVLPATAVLEVAVEKGTVPIVATDPAKGIVTIVPVHADKVREKSWWERTFG